MAAFVLMWVVMGWLFEHEAHKAFGALCGSWIGGTANMIAVAGATGLEGELMGYCLITDSICYAAWLAFLLFCVGYKDRFNAWAKAEAITSTPPASKHPHPSRSHLRNRRRSLKSLTDIFFCHKLFLGSSTIYRHRHSGIIYPS